ncbi:MAG: TetR/AcrR family transcriptional regulator [Oscillospiraceae bacterium]|nr:TetR/AcrR family transcriptional regulator [Oscillospiraceae bacterium]
MARRPVLEGGKRDEIIDAATELFFEHGYEATSVRMIMDKVGGEIGMFYHYFKSKDMLFDKVVEKFFKSYTDKFELLISGCGTPEKFTEAFLPLYAQSMEQFGRLKDNMHWSIQLAMHSRTLMSLVPVITSVIRTWDTDNPTPTGILAGQLIYGISATLHSPEFERMTTDEQKKCILRYIYSVLRG